MIQNPNPGPFVCVRCGQEYQPANLPIPSRHPAHPEDHGEQPPLCRPADLRRRQDQLRGLYQGTCPTCSAGPGQWCRGRGAVPWEEVSLPDMHPARRSAMTL